MFISTKGDEALDKMERAGVLSASEIKSLSKIAFGKDSTSHVNITKLTMTKILRRILSEVGWFQERRPFLLGAPPQRQTNPIQLAYILAKLQKK